ncbi:Helix-turn-helix domain-containing protein [Eubacterium uniforme]|uniref:Helix-turn-helix domain-containing protein n=2 Tax=Eubacterium uniforme TaxID=39495 RepID=A0A1T4W5U9_9FIRM|nr:helix-turn-helix domain-containing protein [Eubacterium uniforme]SKA72415.1 Helix-turn-helix domain-containing protein [Eubacterium uniforme]
MKKINFEIRKEIEELSRKGISQKKMAEILNLNQSTISRELKKCNPYDADKAEKLSVKDKSKDELIISQVLLLRSQGMSLRRISDKLDVYYDAVKKIVENNIKGEVDGNKE